MSGTTFAPTRAVACTSMRPWMSRRIRVVAWAATIRSSGPTRRAADEPWYTALGHTEESWSEQRFLAHILGAIRWAAGAD